MFPLFCKINSTHKRYHFPKYKINGFGIWLEQRHDLETTVSVAELQIDRLLLNFRGLAELELFTNFTTETVFPSR